MRSIVALLKLRNLPKARSPSPLLPSKGEGPGVRFLLNLIDISLGKMLYHAHNDSTDRGGAASSASARTPAMRLANRAARVYGDGGEENEQWQAIAVSIGHLT